VLQEVSNQTEPTGNPPLKTQYTRGPPGLRIITVVTVALTDNWIPLRPTRFSITACRIWKSRPSLLCSVTVDLHPSRTRDKEDLNVPDLEITSVTVMSRHCGPATSSCIPLSPGTRKTYTRRIWNSLPSLLTSDVSLRHSCSKD
ncbi:hypothetical protein BaRGS_00021809, partial [Batillaria attramentaria]